MVLLQSLLAAEQRKLGLDEGQQPGAELLAAVEVANEAELRVELVDRDIQTTLRRAWNKMRFKEKFGLMWALLAEDDSDEELELEQMLADIKSGRRGDFDVRDYYHNQIIEQIFSTARRKAWASISNKQAVQRLILETRSGKVEQLQKRVDTANILNIYK